MVGLFTHGGFVLLGSGRACTSHGCNPESQGLYTLPLPPFPLVTLTMSRDPAALNLGDVCYDSITQTMHLLAACIYFFNSFFHVPGNFLLTYIILPDSFFRAVVVSKILTLLVM